MTEQKRRAQLALVFVTIGFLLSVVMAFGLFGTVSHQWFLAIFSAGVACMVVAETIAHPLAKSEGWLHTSLQIVDGVIGTACATLIVATGVCFEPLVKNFYVMGPVMTFFGGLVGGWVLIAHAEERNEKGSSTL